MSAATLLERVQERLVNRMENETARLHQHVFTQNFENRYGNQNREEAYRIAIIDTKAITSDPSKLLNAAMSRQAAIQRRRTEMERKSFSPNGRVWRSA